MKSSLVNLLFQYKDEVHKFMNQMSNTQTNRIEAEMKTMGSVTDDSYAVQNTSNFKEKSKMNRLE